MKYHEIEDMPTVINIGSSFHESIFRSFQILEKVKVMIARRDSIETIDEVISHLSRKYTKPKEFLHPKEVI